MNCKNDESSDDDCCPEKPTVPVFAVIDSDQTVEGGDTRVHISFVIHNPIMDLLICEAHFIAEDHYLLTTNINKLRMEWLVGAMLACHLEG